MHQKRTQVPTWANDTVEAASIGAEKEKEKEQKKQQKQKKAPVKDDYLNFDSDESEQLSDDEDAADEEDKQGENFVLNARFFFVIPIAGNTTFICGWVAKIVW